MRIWIVLILTIPGLVCAETSLWRVSKDGNELFIGGTIHVLSQDDYPLPSEFIKAYQQADQVVLETDITGLSTPEVQLQMLQNMMYSDGRTLQTVLSPDAYSALQSYCMERGMLIEALARFKPGMVAITLTMAELQKLGIGEAGVDRYFNQLAIADGKALAALETVELQLALLENMGEGIENELILSTLQELHELPVIMATMKKAWREGDLEGLAKIGLDNMMAEYPELYEDILVKRNNAWMPQIKAMLTSPERELVLVGALHLVGHDGVLAKLREQGYNVARY